jgi:ABC-type glycerol-3-phosphate transport system substrate-binding protein
MTRLKIAMFALMLAALIGATGCSTRQETGTSETTTTTTQPTQDNQSTSTTTTTTTNHNTDANTNSGHSSVLGATVHFIGTVVAFPFRLMADAVGEIF